MGGSNNQHLLLEHLSSVILTTVFTWGSEFTISTTSWETRVRAAQWSSTLKHKIKHLISASELGLLKILINQTYLTSFIRGVHSNTMEGNIPVIEGVDRPFNFQCGDQVWTWYCAPQVLPQCQLCTHHSAALTSNSQKKCAGTHHYSMDHNSPSAIQSHSRQGQPATQSHPSPTLIITLEPLRGESGSAGPRTVARKRLYRAKSLCNTTLIQACILLSGWEKYSGGLSRKVCVSVSACQRAYSIRTHILEQHVPNQFVVRVCGPWLMSLS